MIVRIRGSGIAATACAHLLQRAGFQVSNRAVPRRPVPSVMLSATALGLLRDVFDRPDLFAGAPSIMRRVIAWGGMAPVIVPHDALLLSEAQIQHELAWPGHADHDNPAAAADFTIHAAPPMPAGDLHIFGERHAIAVKVRLLDPASASEGRVEAVAAGWLFLVPSSADEGWLLGVGGSMDDLLAQSQLIAPVLDPVGASSIPFMAAPRLFLPLCGADWLACGTAAIGFDPICGDGTAQSVREAILASAVLVAIAEGGDRAALLAHYQSMLIAAMRRHLRLCAQFYRSGGPGDWWRTQHDALMEGHDRCTRLLASAPEPRFVLRDLRLVPRQEAA